MKIKQTADELIIRETPGCLWFMSGFFMLVGGVFVYGSLGGFTNWNSIPWLAISFAFLMGSSGLAVGIWMLSNAPVTKVVINRVAKTVLLTRFRLFSKNENLYDFDQVKEFRLIEGKDDEDNLIWSLGMEFTSGKIEKISSLPNHFQGQKQIFVFQTNEFLGKQMPSAQNVFEIEDESRIKMS